MLQSGVMGLGSKNPTEMLHLLNGNFYLNGTGLKAYFSTGKTNYISSDNSNLIIRSDGEINFKNSTNTLTKMIINATGNVGIGIAPTEKLHVNENAIITGTIISSNVTSTNASDISTIKTITNNMSFGTNFQFKSNGEFQLTDQASSIRMRLAYSTLFVPVISCDSIIVSGNNLTTDISICKYLLSNVTYDGAGVHDFGADSIKTTGGLNFNALNVTDRFKMWI